MTLNGFEASVGRAGQLLAGPQQQLPWVEWHNLENQKEKRNFLSLYVAGFNSSPAHCLSESRRKIILFRSRIYFVCLILIYRIASGLALYLTEHFGSLVKWLRRHPFTVELQVQFLYELLDLKLKSSIEDGITRMPAIMENVGSSPTLTAFGSNVAQRSERVVKTAAGWFDSTLCYNWDNQ